jgi:UDP-2-acetamido-3-amino-2,3-dideoxy-glucuronate N-acetyltransferase
MGWSISRDKFMDNKMKVAVIGSGYWGKNLIRNFHKIGALEMICDKNVSLLSEFKKEYDGIETCFALSDVLMKKEIHGVVIATPAETHFNLAREALLAGKHVYVEKPLTLHEEEGEVLIALAKERKKVLMVGHLLQFHPVFVKLKELVMNGDLGKINYIYSHRLNLGKIRREENILWSFAPHDISMILALAGEEPENVIATGGNYLHQKIADVTTTHLEFPSGLRAHIFVSWLHPFKEQKLVVVGDRKMAVFDDTLPWQDKLLLYPHQINWHHNVPVPTKADPERVEIAQSEPLYLECLHFLECLSNGKKAITDGEEGLRVLRILNASQRSLNAFGEKMCLSESDGAKPILKKPHDGGEKSLKPEAFIHETAVIDSNVDIGKDSRIWHFSHVLAGTRIGERCNIGQNVVIGPDVTIGNGCKIQNNVSVYKGVTIEDEVFCGPSMVFTNVYNPRAHIRRMDEARKTLVRKGASLGANCTIVCGHTIGEYAFVGAGAVVIEDVPDYALVAGNPAKVKGWMCRCSIRLHFDKSGRAVCDACGLKYSKKENLVTSLDGAR